MIRTRPSVMMRLSDQCHSDLQNKKLVRLITGERLVLVLLYGCEASHDHGPINMVYRSVPWPVNKRLMSYGHDELLQRNVCQIDTLSASPYGPRVWCIRARPYKTHIGPIRKSRYGLPIMNPCGAQIAIQYVPCGGCIRAFPYGTPI